MRKYHLLASIATLATGTIGALPTSHPALWRVSAEEAPAVPLVHTGLLRSMFKDMPDPLIRVMTTAFKALMEEQTGLASDVNIADNPEELTVRLKEGKLQVGAYHGFEFAWARQKNPDLKPLMIAAKGQPFCRTFVVVRQECKAADVTALQGKTVAVPLLARQHCRLYLKCRCVPKDIAPEKWFGKVSTPRTDRDALDDVADGSADAAVVDDVELEAFRKAYPKTGARLRVLQQSEMFPAVVIAYQPGALNEETLKRLRAGMIAAKTTERGRKLLGLFHLTGFEEVPDDFERTVAEIAKAYPPPGK